MFTWSPANQAPAKNLVARVYVQNHIAIRKHSVIDRSAMYAFINFFRALRRKVDEEFHD